MKNSLWIVVWRMNPPHVWHIELIKKSLKDNKYTLLFIWTKGKKDSKNPFWFDEIKYFLQLIFSSEIKNKLLIIDEIKDVSWDDIWVKNLFQKIKHNCFAKTSCSIPSPLGGGLGRGNRKFFNFLTLSNIKNIIFYGGDLKNDYAVLCIKKYISFFEWYKILFKELYRYKKVININWKKINISSTNLRKALNDSDSDVFSEMIDKRMLSEFLKLFS